jgi:fructose-bisphosphate aldolase class II/tagatose 1,6-diphosphate aldolase GatY/KbaY
MGLETAVSLARTGLRQFGVEGWIHLDHGDSANIARACLDAGFDSIMIDGSELPLEENIRLTKEVVQLAAPYGVNVEAELGFVAKLGQSHLEHGFTRVEEAVVFAEETGIDALAIAIGTAHGFYREAPKLQFDLLASIRANIDTVLVLHGGSGVPADQLQRAITGGICKVNLATEIKNIFMKTLQSVLQSTQEIDLRKVFPVATNSVKELVMDKLKVVQNNPVNCL